MFNGDKFVVVDKRSLPVWATSNQAHILGHENALQKSINEIDSFAYSHGYEYHSMTDDFVVLKRLQSEA